jgi:hypothetical protein
MAPPCLLWMIYAKTRCRQCDQKFGKNNPKFVKKSSQKGKNIFIKAQFEFPTCPYQTTFENLKTSNVLKL